MRFNSILIAIALSTSGSISSAQEDLSDCKNFLSVSGKFFGLRVSGNVLTEDQKAFCNALQAFADSSSLRHTETETRLEAAEAEIEILRGRLRGSVVAFDRTQEDPCPNGWTLYSPAQARMVVGAGLHGSPNLTEYPSFSDNPEQATGGAEKVTLAPKEMPAHRHAIPLVTLDPPFRSQSLGQNAPYFDYRTRDDVKIDIAMSSDFHGVGVAGASVAHNNLPPFIALYFCKKD